MSYENFGRRANSGSDIEVYSPDGATTFNWHYADGDDWRLGGWNYTNPALAIEAAWLWLAGQGGGQFRTRGPGETWTTVTQINSQGDNVTWLSDWGLTIRAQDDLNTTVVLINNSNIVLDGIRVDANKAGQSVPVYPVNGIYINSTLDPHDNIKILRCIIEDAYHHGIQIESGAAINRVSRVEVAFCSIIDCGWNGIQAAAGTLKAWIHHNYVRGSSDVGISVICNPTNPTVNVLVEYNIIEDITGTDGFNDAHWGGGVEGSNAEDIEFSHNHIINCPGRGLTISGTADHRNIRFIDNTLTECGNGGAPSAGIRVDDLVEDYTIRGNTLNECAYNNGYAIQLQAPFYVCSDNNIFVIDNAIVTGFNGIRLSSDAHDGKVCDNTIRVTQSGGNQVGINNRGASRVKFQDNDIIQIEDTGILFGGTGNDDCTLDGNYIFGTVTGINIDDGDDISILNNRIQVSGNAIDINNAACVSAFVDVNNLEGSGAGCVDGAATTPMYGNNVNAAGTITRDLVPP